MRLGLLVLALTACDGGFHGPCGNGAIDPYEECDDGNIESGDLCSANCTREPSCGDRVIDSPMENCDDGNTVPGDNCDETCHTETVCGDLDIEPGEMCEDGNADPGDGCSETCTIEYKVSSEVRWQFVTASDLVDLGCPAGFDTIEIATQVLHLDGSPAGDPVIERVPCETGLRAKQWYVGSYRVSVQAIDGTGVGYAPPIESMLELRAGQRDVLAQFVVDGGVAQIGWRMIDRDTGEPRTCAQLGVLDVGVLATAPGFSRGHFVLCPEGHAETQALPAGDYTLRLTAFDNLGNEMGIETRTITITAPNGRVDGGTVDIAID